MAVALLAAQVSWSADAPGEFDFHVSAQPLAEALMQFGQETGSVVIAPTTLTTGKTSLGAEGRMSGTAALAKILAGSSLNYSWREQNTIVILGPNAVGSGNAAHTAGASRPLSTTTGGVGFDLMLGEIVVTGSLIGDPSLAKPAPVAVVSDTEISLRQANVAEELLRNLPGVVPGIGANVSNSSYGPSTLNLRGLGQNRNLVLIDGARITPWGFDGSVDLNDIPLALIDRVEILTGGATTTYGADAVAGVVNFITKRNFAGLEVNASDQLNERGDGNTLRADLTAGGNFADGRGNVMFSVGYQDSHGLYRTDRAFSSIAMDSFTGTPGTSATTVPGVFYLPGVGLQQLNAATGTLGAVMSPYNESGAGVLQTPFERVNLYMASQLKITDHLEAYEQAFYVMNSVEAPYSPTGTYGATLGIPYSNAYLPAAVRVQFCDANGLTAAQCSAAAAATNPSDQNYRTFTTNVYRRFAEEGRTGFEADTDLYQFRAGLRGSITDRLKFDVFATYGHSDNADTVSGDALYSRLQQAVLASSTTSCFSATNGCVPLNLFGGLGSVTPAQLSFLAPSASTVRLLSDLGTVRGVINGDFDVVSPFAQSPVGVALGAEYRRYTVRQVPDHLASLAGELLDDGATPAISGGYNVHEEFLETIAPVIEGRPFIKALTINLGARESDYSTLGRNFTWKAGGSWEPVAGLKIRGDYQIAVRAPNIGELYTPRTAGYDSLTSDPCAGAGVTPDSAIGRICIAQGAPRSALGTIANSTEVNVLTGGNPNLDPERAQTSTVGVVFQPEQLKSLSASIDYYRILVTNAITAPTVDDVFASCFSPTVNPALAVTTACTSIRRDPVTGSLDGSFATTAGVPEFYSNEGRLSTDGVDLAASQLFHLHFGSLSIGFDGNYTRSAKFQSSPGAIDRECVGYYSVNCVSLQPRLTWNQRTTLSVRGVDLSLLWRHISAMEYEPQALIDEGGSADGPLAAYRHIAAYDYLDFTTKWRVTQSLQLTFLIQNMTDKSPPAVGSTIGDFSFNTANTYPATYDVMGRRYGLSLNAKF